MWPGDGDEGGGGGEELAEMDCADERGQSTDAAKQEGAGRVSITPTLTEREEKQNVRAW